MKVGILDLDTGRWRTSPHRPSCPGFATGRHRRAAAAAPRTVPRPSLCATSCIVPPSISGGIVERPVDLLLEGVGAAIPEEAALRNEIGRRRLGRQRRLQRAGVAGGRLRLLSERHDHVIAVLDVRTDRECRLAVEIPQRRHGAKAGRASRCGPPMTTAKLAGGPIGERRDRGSSRRTSVPSLKELGSWKSRTPSSATADSGVAPREPRASRDAGSLPVRAAARPAARSSTGQWHRRRKEEAGGRQEQRSQQHAGDCGHGSRSSLNDPASMYFTRPRPSRDRAHRLLVSGKAADSDDAARSRTCP